VSVALKKVPAVTQVRVSLHDGLTVLDLKPGNTMTLTELREIIKHNGFVSKEATVIARGAMSADQKTLTVDGTHEQLVLTPPPERIGEDWRVVVRARDTAKQSSDGTIASRHVLAFDAASANDQISYTLSDTLTSRTQLFLSKTCSFRGRAP
jgi:hypothetical protein